MVGLPVTKGKKLAGKSTLTTARLFRAEGKGYGGRRFLSHQKIKGFATKSFDQRGLGNADSISRSPLFPDIPGYGGSAPGQNGDSFLSRKDRAVGGDDNTAPSEHEISRPSSLVPVLSQLVLFLSLGCLSAVIGRRTNDADGEDDRAPLPRAKRRRRGRKEDQGLAPDDELAKLARFYLTYTKKLWPELAKAGLISEPSDITIQEMVDDFKARHRTGKVDSSGLKPFRRIVEKLAALYPRYSDHNSQPNSISDQM